MDAIFQIAKPSRYTELKRVKSRHELENGDEPCGPSLLDLLMVRDNFSPSRKSTNEKRKWCHALRWVECTTYDAQFVVDGSKKLTLTWESFSISSNLCDTLLAIKVRASWVSESAVQGNWVITGLSMSLTIDIRGTGAIAREWNWPSVERVVSMAVWVAFMISLRPVQNTEIDV